jgi:addiction module HigA family antidote
MAWYHPGKILYAKFLKPMGLSQNRLARAIGVPPRRINEIVLGKRAITADTAVRLARYFSNEPAYWMKLQTDYDIALAINNMGMHIYSITQHDSGPTETASQRTQQRGQLSKANRERESRNNIRRRLLRSS